MKIGERVETNSTKNIEVPVSDITKLKRRRCLCQDLLYGYAALCSCAIELQCEGRRNDINLQGSVGDHEDYRYV